MHWILLLLLLYIAWCAMLYVMQDRLMFPTHLVGGSMRPAHPTAELLVLEPRESGGTVRVEACYFPPTSASPRAAAPLAVFFHGNAETMDNCFDPAREWLDREHAVLLIEYRGYGECTGSPCEKHLVADSITFIEQVAERPEVDRSRVVLHGRSLGAAVAAQVAARLARPETPRDPPITVRAIIAQSTFSSVPRLVARMLAPPFLIRNPFRTDRALADLGIPVLILHGMDDEIVPVSHARHLHRVIRTSTLVELPGHHNDFPLDEAAYWAAIDRFLVDNGLAPPPR